MSTPAELIEEEAEGVGEANFNDNSDNESGPSVTGSDYNNSNDGSQRSNTTTTGMATQATSKSVTIGGMTIQVAILCERNKSVRKESTLLALAS